MFSEDKEEVPGKNLNRAPIFGVSKFTIGLNFLNLEKILTTESSSRGS